MITDGDSKAYGSIWDPMVVLISVRNGRRWTSGQQSTRNGASPRSMRFGNKTMKAERQSVQGFQKLDCIGHVQKRMGTLVGTSEETTKAEEWEISQGSKHWLTDKH